MKKITVIFLFVFLSKQAHGSGTLSFSARDDFTTHQLSSSASLGVSEKIYRRVGYSGSLGYSHGWSDEFNFTKAYTFSTGHGIGIKVTDDFNVNLQLGITYHSNQQPKAFTESLSLKATYLLWD